MRVLSRKARVERTCRLLKCNRRERPQHEPRKKADEPHDAVRDAADTGRKDLGSERGAWTPETQEAEAPAEAKNPEPEVRGRMKPERHEDRAPDEQCDETDASADLVGEPTGRAEPEKPTRPQKT